MKICETSWTNFFNYDVIVIWNMETDKFKKQCYPSYWGMQPICRNGMQQNSNGNMQWLGATLKEQDELKMEWIEIFRLTWKLWQVKNEKNTLSTVWLGES